MVKKYLRVVYNFDVKKDYGIKIRPQYKKCLATLHKGQKINPEQFIKEHLDEFTLAPRSYKVNQVVIYHSLSIGKKIGMIEELTLEEQGIAKPYEEFCKLETVSYFMEQLRGSRYKNVDPKKPTGTANCYAYRLWHFNNWISGKSFEFNTETQTGGDTFKREKKSIKIESVEHLLKLYEKPYKVDSDFIRVVKKYLLDPMHRKKRAGSVKIDYCAIKAYFEKNDLPLNFKFDANVKYRTTNGEDEQPSLTLDNVMDLLTVGNPSLTQKAVFLCKLHRGLDSSTLVDRFNFQAWEQLVEYFGTDNYKSWNTSACPVPIKLTRMKTDYTHTGYLDIDAVEAIIKYLDYRKNKTSQDIKKGQPLFLNERNQPITGYWILLSLKKLAKNAGLDQRLAGYAQVKYKINPHEFRDLLKSTLIDCGVRSDLTDHFIGHKPKDSYEKQAILYPETMRSEYSKASKKLNVFSNFSNYVKGFEDTTQMKEQIKQLESQQAVHIETQKTMLAMLKQRGVLP